MSATVACCYAVVGQALSPANRVSGKPTVQNYRDIESLIERFAKLS
jgi:hypothetical protein